MEARRHLATVVAALMTTERHAAESGAEFDYEAAFEELSDAAAPLVLIVNDADRIWGTSKFG